MFDHLRSLPIWMQIIVLLPGTYTIFCITMFVCSFVYSGYIMMRYGKEEWERRFEEKIKAKYLNK